MFLGVLLQLREYKIVIECPQSAPPTEISKSQEIQSRMPRQSSQLFGDEGASSLCCMASQLTGSLLGMGNDMVRLHAYATTHNLIPGCTGPRLKVQQSQPSPKTYLPGIPGVKDSNSRE